VGSQSQTLLISKEQIRLRAYELFIEREGRRVFAGEDWDRAEAEVLAKYNGKKRAYRVKQASC